MYTEIGEKIYGLHNAGGSGSKRLQAIVTSSILKFLTTLDAVTLALMVRNNSTLLSADAALLAHPYIVMGRPMDYKVLLPDTKPFF
jgi:hypothetical protein